MLVLIALGQKLICLRMERTIVVSPFEIYSQYFPNDIQVNGLPINAAEFEAELHLIEYFKTNVIRGDEAFLIIADGFDDFERAMREKLLMEIYPNAFLAKSN